MTLIILDGNECNYKSTIADKLHSKLGYELVKGSSFELATSGNDYLNKTMISFANLDDVILDRFIYSNLVYASIKQDYSILSLAQVQHIEDIIKDKALVVYLHAPSEVLVGRLEERGDEYIKSNELAGINKVYKCVMADTQYRDTVDFIEFDTSEQSSDEIAISILNYLKLKEEVKLGDFE